MKKKKFLLAVITLIWLLGAAGCSAGSTIDTKLQVNKDLSGQRLMSISIDNDVFEEYFNGTFADLNNYISANCPEQLQWSYSEETGYSQYVFVLAFQNIEEYEKKVAALMGEEKTIEISVPDSIWASGIYVDEDFSSGDLLQWLTNGLVNTGYVSDENASMIFDNGTTEVEYGGNMYGSYSDIYVDEVEYIDIYEINIYTEMSDFDTYNRKVEFIISKSSLVGDEDQVKKYFQAFSSDHISTGYLVENGTVTYMLEKLGMDISELKNFDQIVFGVEDELLTNTNQDGVTDALTFERAISENINLSQYVVGNAHAPEFHYYVKSAEDYNVFSENGTKVQADEEREGYGLVWSDSEVDRTVNWYLKKHFKTQNMSVELGRNSIADSWKQKMELTLEQVPTEEESAQIEKLFQTRLGIEQTEEGSEETTEQGTEEKNEEKKAHASVQLKQDKDGNCQIIILQKGKKTQIEENMLSLANDNIRLYYGTDWEFWKIKKQEAYDIACDFSGLLGEVSDQFSMEYRLNVGLMPTMQYIKCSGDDETVGLQGNALVFSQTTPGICILYTGTRVDGLSVVFWGLTTAGIVFLCITLKKKKKEVEPKRPLSKKNSGVKYCENCGALRKAGTRYCEECGVKFED